MPAVEEDDLLQFQRGPTHRWNLVNPILEYGEPGVEYLPNGDIRVKVGDGSRAWTELPYVTARHDHDQPIASASWVINHGLGFYPDVTAVEAETADVLVGTIIHHSIHQLEIQFLIPVAGHARCS